MITTEITIPESIDIAINPIKERALALVVTNPEEKQVAGNMYIDIALWEKNVKAYFKPMKDAANQAHKAITSRENEQLARAAEIKDIIAPKLAAYTQKEEKDRADAEAKAIDKYNQGIKNAGLKAEELLKAGKQSQAEQVLQKAITATPEVKAPEPVKVAGLAMVEDYEITITNPDLVPREYCVPDEVLIRRDIKNWNGKKQIPGVTFVKTLKPRRTGRA